MRIFLRPITEEDGRLIVKWRNTDNIRNHCFDKTVLTEEINRDFYKKNVLTGKYKQYIVERIEEQCGVASYPIATIYLKDIDNVNHRCELCIFTSDDEEWNTESQRIAINIMLEIAVQELKMHKIYSYVFVNNEDPIELLTSAGFSIEATLKQEAIDINGAYGDVYRLAVIL